MIALYYFINKKIKKCKSWISTSSVSSISGLIIYVIIMSWIVFEYIAVEPSISLPATPMTSYPGVEPIPIYSIEAVPSSSSWGIGIYIFFIGVLFSLVIVFRDYATKINELYTEGEGESDLNNLDEEDPIKILNLRYAKGEISKEEFEQMKKDFK